MPRNQATSIKAYQLVDIVTIVVCSIVMHRIRNDFWVPQGNYLLLTLVILFLTMNMFSWWDVYRQQEGRWLYKTLTNLTIAWFVVALCLGLITFFTKSGENFSRFWFAATFTSSYAIMLVTRVALWNFFRDRRSNEDNLRNIVVIGAGQLGQRAIDAIIEERWAGLKVTAIFDDTPHKLGTNYRGVEVKGSINDAIDFIEQRRKANLVPVKEVWIALPLKAAEKIQQLQSSLENTATNVYLVPDLFGASLSRYSLVESAGMMMINLSGSQVNGLEKLKRIEDIIITLTMGFVLSPLLLLTALFIKLDSPGPIFFKQRRYGLDGKEILVWKFRSMHVTQDDDNVPQAVAKDARVTSVGRFIRRYSIDELPQLLNVFNGSMSLVGPRPHAVAHNEYYRDKVHGYMARHKMLPGITGWAQVNGCRGETEVIEKMQRRLRYDLEYIQNWSIALDIRILIKTFFTILRDENAY